MEQPIHEQSKVTRIQYLWERLFYSIILSVRPAEWTPLPSLSDKTLMVDCCVSSTRNRGNCGGVIPLFAVRWGHHKPSLSLSMTFSDGNAHQHDSWLPLAYLMLQLFISGVGDGWRTKDSVSGSSVGNVWVWNIKGTVDCRGECDVYSGDVNAGGFRNRRRRDSWGFGGSGSAVWAGLEISNTYELK
jgi:hypothetical protein